LRSLDGRVALITGAARGQGRSHCVVLAEHGAKVVGIDICDQIGSVGYAMATRKDLDETLRQVERVGGEMLALTGDVRSKKDLETTVAAGCDRFGPIDIVVANAGISGLAAEEADPEAGWNDAIDVMLTGVWRTLQATVPQMIEAGRGGAIVITSSSGAMKATSTLSGGGDGYMAAKAGVVGLMRGYAHGLATHSIRVNTIHPAGVNTPMIHNDDLRGYVAAHPHVVSRMQNALPVEALEPEDISQAVLWLVGDSGRYVTGISLPLDAGLLL
jgi:SDR family mycofactocin-dependent oxidoreductase